MEEEANISASQQDKTKRFFKNIIIVLISNVFSVVSGVLIGFIIPKIMGVSEYGYYKTFTLYSSYIGILHFGFIDGIYLKFAGKEYDDLDKEKFRTFTRFLILLEASISLIVLFISFIFYGTEYFLVFLLVSFNILVTNIVTYFEFISQITLRFKRTTIRNIIRCVLNITSVIVLYLLYKYNSVVIYNYIYILICLSIMTVLALWYIYSYRDITFGKGTSFKEEKGEIFSIIKVGIPLMMSNLISQLVFIVDQQFVNIAFDNDTYSLYAFAYNMISLITVATNAVSIVLYPTLKTLRQDSIERNYSKINSYALMAVALCLAAYFPLVLIVNYFLPKYIDSLPTFLIILPGVLISSSITVVKYNCCKTFGKVNNFFIKSVIMLGVAILADLIVYLIFKDTRSISIVSIGVLLVWYILIEIMFIRTYKVKWIRNIIYILLVIGGFYGISFIPNIYASFGAYLGFYIAITLIMYYNTIKELIDKFKARRAAKNAVAGE